MLKRLQAAGQAIIFITHKLAEVLEIADRITVLRQGRVVQHVTAAEADQRTLARLMVGREVVLARPLRRQPPGAVALTVADLWVDNDRNQPALRGVSFTAHQGEIFGITGVAGNGQHELVEVLAGLRHPRAGTVCIWGQDVTHGNVRSRMTGRLLVAAGPGRRRTGE